MSTTSRKRKSYTADAAGAPVKRKRHNEASNACDDEFYIARASLVLPIPPTFVNDPRAGVEEMLDSMVMRYIQVLRGVLVSHSNTAFLTKTAPLLADCPYPVCKISFDATVWSPQIGMRLVGKINLCSPDHIALLLHRTFNVSIPRHHIPIDSWQFEHGFHTPGSDENEMEGRGRWRHRITGDVLGGPDGYVKFTVVGMTVANEMLSLYGSLLSDPFLPAHGVVDGTEADAGEADAGDE